MKLGTFAVATPLGEVRRIGVAEGDGVIDATAARIALLERSLPRAAAERVGAAQVPPDMLSLIASGEPALDWLREAVAAALADGAPATAGGQRLRYAMEEIRLLAPVPRPPAIANFSCWPAHGKAGAARGSPLRPAEEGSGILPYWKGNPDSYVGPGTVLRPPSYAESIDVECEFVAIVGTGGRDLDRAAARRAIVGYTIVNDTSARRQQMLEMKTGRGPAKGKDFDGGNVMGPWLVTPESLGDVRAQRLSLVVNGEELSTCSSAEMSWDFEEMLSYLSRDQTVLPGQVLSAGCYHRGCGLDLERIFVPGDVVELRISGIGALVNPIGARIG
jgi:2-keto-4-pentenoate hydratase/2-oxohepta-3-ene-1,7-dioic acid hydratase in catechol pathway